MAQKYPYQNLSLKNIKGEKWEDIPGLDGYYLISNFGRVKRQEYEQQYSDGRIFIRKPKIIKPTLRELPNSYVNDTVHFLTTGVTLYKSKTNISIARMVYHLFVKPINLSDKKVLIIARDGDGCNIKPANLIAVSLSQRQKRIYDLNRNISAFTFKEFQGLGVKKSIIQNSKQISQYNTDGKRIKTFSSITAACEATGISNSRIGQVANGIDLTAGGYVWRFGKTPKVDFKSFLELKRKHHKEIVGKKITQYDMEGNRIAQYPTITDAEKITGVATSGIHLILRGIRKSAGGFVWKTGYGKSKIDLSNYIAGKQWRTMRRWKKVIQQSLKNKYLRKFPSVNEAAKSVGVSPSTLSATLNGRQNTCGGYKWKFA